ncbi:hypothetical protein BZG21_43755, partial [Escherichia coli]|nr:hypothetical protein [Escherichia coli]
MRITPATMAFNAERNLNAAASRLAAIQDKIGSTKEINRPSDDPAGAAEVMSLHSQQRQNEQFTRNASNAAGWLSTADVALGTATDLLHRVRDLTMRGSNSGALSPEARQA